MLKLEHVKKNYKDFQLDVSMEIKSGCVTGLIGKNGAGKTTAFKEILGLIRKDGGNITILGKQIEQMKAKDREDIGVVLSDSGFSGYLKLKDYIPVMKAMYSKFDEDAFVKECERFQIPIDKKIKEFSTGMKRKALLIAALSHDAKLLILDEPTSGLDVVARDELLDVLREYMEQEDRAILISSHISSDLENFCDDIYMIDDGKIILHEETDKLLSDYAILKVTEEEYQKLDKDYILRKKKEGFGYQLLTDQKQFYQENYPQIVIEKGGIDELMLMMIRGEA